MIHSAPVGLPQLAATLLGLLAFAVAVSVARLRAGRDPRDNPTRSRRSKWGIVIQGLGIGGAALGAPRVTLDPTSAGALVRAGIVAVLMTACILLFAWAVRVMGRNWSIVARTRDDHHLVTAGPFAYARHPIYVALFLLMLALATGFGHLAALIVTLPLFAFGTWLRVGEEERLLRAKFGSAYDRYAVHVRRFVPMVF